jgi:hypothetical protein
MACGGIRTKEEPKRKPGFARSVFDAYVMVDCRSCVLSWSKAFSEPIPLPDGTEIDTLRDAIRYLAKSIPAREHKLPAVQAAALCVTQAAENGGSMMMARVGMMQAIHRHERAGHQPRRKPAKKFRIVR